MSTGASSNPQHLGKYELRERLGRGGMAEVWKAFDPQLERYVAIKILHADLQADPEFLTRFTREARVIASLHHPNIVQIHDFQVINQPETKTPFAYMVMDYVEGQTLADYIRSTSRIGKFPPPADIVQLFVSISRAVDYAHQQGMIHRDIKPANILLDKRHTTHNPIGEPILTDFGIAKLLGVSTGTVSGAWIGTPLYISPEQAQGHPGNERSDIYSLGVILYEMCTGVQPFQGESIPAILMQHVSTMPTSPALMNPNIPPALIMVIMRCLAKDPATRYSSASSMTAALAEAVNIPIPSDMIRPLYPVDVMSGPTYLSNQLNPPQVLGSVSPLSSPMAPMPGSQSAPNPAPEMAPSPVVAQSSPRTPVINTPNVPSFSNFVQYPQAIPAQPQSSVTPQGPSTPIQRLRNRKLIPFIAALIIVLVGSGLGGFYWLTHKSSTVVMNQNQIAGHAFFVSSGQYSAHNSQGINDILIVDLQNIPNPAPNKSYFGWLLGDESQPLATPIFLGKLPVSGGNIHFLYPGDTHHTDLMAITSRFLITEEDANSNPSNPSPDQSNWRYYSVLPQSTPTSTTGPSTMATSTPASSTMATSTPASSTMGTSDMMNDSVLQHLRHLLADAPELTRFGLYGGLDIWLLRNTQKILEWAGSARDATDAAFMQRQVIRILAYLDGVQYFGSEVPPGTPLLAQLPNASVAMLEFDVQKQDPPGYLTQIGLHLNALTQAPGVTRERRALAAQIDQEVNNMQTWLEQVHKDAKQLMYTPLSQYNSPASQSIFDDMATNALYAFVGRLDPSSGQVQGGMIQIHYNMQNLATYDVAPYSSH